MCWVCNRLEALAAGWNEESEFQGQTGTDFHRGMSKAFGECAKDLSEAVASLQHKGICERLPEREDALNDPQRWDIINEILKWRDEDSNQE